MCYLLKAATMPLLKERIKLTQHPFHITNEAIRLAYMKYESDGFVRKSYVMERYGNAELSLFERGIVSKLDGSGSSLKMYKKRLHTMTVGPQKRPVQMVSEVEIEWDEIELTAYEMIDLIANWEYKITGRVMGLIPYPGQAHIIPMNRPMKYLPGQTAVMDLKNVA